MIESGRSSASGNWGVFEPFKSKDNTLSWLNYILGYLIYHRLNQKNEGIIYYYKSTLFNKDSENRLEAYIAIGEYYFDEVAKLDTLYSEKRTTNENKDNDETKRLLGLARGNADRAIDAFGRAYKIAVKTKANKNLIDATKKTLDDLYRFRFNIPPDVKPEGVEIYFEKLISQPMPDPSTKVEHVLQ